LAILLLSTSQCKKEKEPTLPPETQEAKGTIGCLINGKVFVQGAAPHFGESGVQALYAKYNNSLEIDAYLHPEGRLKIKIFNPVVNTPVPIALYYYYSDKDHTNCSVFGGMETGEFVLTRFDTTAITIGRHVVSGRFKFDGQCSDPSLTPVSDSTISVTDGRFDIMLEGVNWY